MRGHLKLCRLIVFMTVATVYILVSSVSRDKVSAMRERTQRPLKCLNPGEACNQCTMQLVKERMRTFEVVNTSKFFN